MQTEDILWQGRDKGDLKSTKEIATKYFSLVKVVAILVKRKMPYHVSLDDLIGWGSIGLMIAIKNFKPEMGFKFSTYAKKSIWGYCIEGFRGKETFFGRGAKEHNKNIKCLSQMYSDEYKENIVQLEDKDSPNQFEQSMAKDLFHRFTRHIVSFENQIILLRYRNDMSFIEIGKVFGLSGSAIGGYHALALRRIKSKGGLRHIKKKPMVKVCCVADCKEPYASSGYCYKHYRRYLRSKNVHSVAKNYGEKGVCSVDGCGKTVHGHGFCMGHVRNYIKFGDPLKRPPERLCTVPGCGRKYDKRGYCALHDSRMQRIGALELPVREVKICSVDGCGKKARTRNYCPTHYSRWIKNRDTSISSKQKV